MPNQNLVSKNEMRALNQAQSSFASGKKKEALEKFNSIPMPKEREEEWRYTDIGEFKFDNFRFNDSATRISVELSDNLIERGIVLMDINTALEKYPIAREHFLKGLNIEKDKLAAFNSSHFNNGFFLYVPKNIEIEEPIRVNFNFEGQTSILHNLVVVEANSRVDFIEEYSNNEVPKEQLNSAITEIFANENSKINFYHLNDWTKNVYNFTNVIGTVEKDASINFVSGCFGGKLNKLKIDTIFTGQGSQCNNLGVFLGKGKEHIDFTTNMYHNVENTTNDVLVDGILKDESSSVYRGLIKIEKQAQKTNSYLANHILKLGQKTLANSIPSLKIDANDVKASHGATVGQINEEHLFYLMARGLSRQEAETLIVEGFFEPIIQKIPLEELREKIREMVRK